MVDFNKQLLLKDFSKSGDKLLFAKALDRALFSIKQRDVFFTDFLDPVRLSSFMQKLSCIKELSVSCFGGFDDSERKLIALAPAGMEVLDFPIKIVKIDKNPRAVGELLHRHCLGSILGLGIDRCKIGDIKVLPQSAFACVHSDIVAYIVTNLDYVSKIKVNADVVDCASFSQEELTVCKITVASLRADVVISAVFKMSRSKSKSFISSEKLFVNWSIVKNADYQLKEGDVVTLRGFGRIKFIKTLGVTKKDRLLIEFHKY